MKKMELLRNPVRVLISDEQGNEMVLFHYEIETAKDLIDSVYCQQDVEEMLEEKGYVKALDNKELIEKITAAYQTERKISDGSDCDSCKDWRQCIDVVFETFKTQLEPYRRENG